MDDFEDSDNLDEIDIDELEETVLDDEENETAVALIAAYLWFF